MSSDGDGGSLFVVGAERGLADVGGNALPLPIPVGGIVRLGNTGGDIAVVGE